MRKIVAGLFTSLDGVVESPDRWVFPYFNDEVGQAVGASINESDTVLLGRRLYEEWSTYWPGKTAKDDPFADYINNTPKVVVSSTLQSVSWTKTTIVRGSRAEIMALKHQPGKNIGCTGSATLIRSLLRDGLLDELRLLVFPVVIGSGRRLFDGITEPLPMKLMASTATTTGVLSLTYTPTNSANLLEGSQAARVAEKVSAHSRA